MKLQKNQTQQVELQIEVEGTSEKLKPRLLIKNENVAVVYEGSFKDKKTAVFEVSKLDKIFETNVAQAELEVIVEGRYFTPWKSQIEFESPISFKVNESQIDHPPKPAIKVTANVKKSTVEVNQPLKAKINGKIEEVFVTKILENGLVEVMDINKKMRKIKIK